MKQFKVDPVLNFNLTHTCMFLTAKYNCVTVWDAKW